MYDFNFNINAEVDNPNCIYLLVQDKVHLHALTDCM